MQTCFFALSGVLPRDEAIAADQGGDQEDLRQARRGGRGAQLRGRRRRAGGAARGARCRTGADELTSRRPPLAGDAAPDFVQRVTRDDARRARATCLPVSALPVDGTFPTGTARCEKRSIAHEIPIWDPTICIQCGLCRARLPARGDPHEGRSRPSALDGAPGELPVACRGAARSCPDHLTDDPGRAGRLHGLRRLRRRLPGARARRWSSTRRSTWSRSTSTSSASARTATSSSSCPRSTARSIDDDTVKGSQLLRAAVRVLRRLRGLRRDAVPEAADASCSATARVIANATGCSSIYGGNLPTTPWAKNAEGRGPAWSNSLFEDNAEFGLGMRLAIDAQRELRGAAGDAAARPSWATALADGAARVAAGRTTSEIAAQRARVKRAEADAGATCESPKREQLLAVADALVRAQRVDRRRRRLGLRHRLRRPRPRARDRAAT